LAFGCALAAATFFFPAAARAADFELLELDGHFVKWGPTELGTGATVRYAYLTDSAQFPNARNCRHMGSLTALLQRSRIEWPALRAEAAAAFAMWEAAADIKFLPADDPRDADILIGAQTEPRGWAFANVEYDRSGVTTTRRIERSLICLDPTKPWKVGFGGNAFAYDLRYALAHEIGHAIGLNHPSPSGQLMSFKYGERFRVLQTGDLEGAIALYGKRDTTRAAAAPPSPVGAASPTMGLR
jgi:hypothetical protein